MRIDGTIRPDHLHLPTGKPSKSSKSKASHGSDAGETERVSAHQSLIRTALGTDDLNTKAIEEARQALEAGELDTFQAAKSTAQKIVDLGF